MYSALQNIISGESEIKGRKVKTSIPTILKPYELWTGKQVISTVLDTLVEGLYEKEGRVYQREKFGLNLDSKAKINGSVWGPYAYQQTSVTVRANSLLMGILDKAQFGASQFGLVHSFHQLYGPRVILFFLIQ